MKKSKRKKCTEIILVSLCPPETTRELSKFYSLSLSLYLLCATINLFQLIHVFITSHCLKYVQ